MNRASASTPSMRSPIRSLATPTSRRHRRRARRTRGAREPLGSGCCSSASGKGRALGRRTRNRPQMRAQRAQRALRAQRAPVRSTSQRTPWPTNCANWTWVLILPPALLARSRAMWLRAVPRPRMRSAGHPARAPPRQRSGCRSRSLGKGSGVWGPARALLPSRPRRRVTSSASERRWAAHAARAPQQGRCARLRAIRDQPEQARGNGRALAAGMATSGTAGNDSVLLGPGWARGSPHARRLGGVFRLAQVLA
mmetsp:Transcript_23178/g.68295  ORF Transcript_23178/g.68295 Transcript_23178/m.68295 type:complete len:253 (-) Transcript_23178:134-892(-)